jgi:hypothetical protein
VPFLNQKEIPDKDKSMTRHFSFFLPLCLIFICFAPSIHAQEATTNCAYTFTSGTGNSYLNYCVTVNGNIPKIIIGVSSTDLHTEIGEWGEGYGICNESPAQNYTDYGVSDTGNWNSATLVSHTTNSVKIARTTSDGNWTLTQTITKVPQPPSINVVMALTNNQSTNHVAYLVRFADAIPGPSAFGPTYSATLNSAFGWDYVLIGGETDSGLELHNVGNPPFGFWQAYAQTVQTGPNACAFAFNASNGLYQGLGSIEIAYVGTVAAHQTKTVTLRYHGL